MILSPKAWWTYLWSSGANFHVVVPRTADGRGGLYRSATPSPGNLARWSEEYGIKTWIDLRMPSDYSDHSFFTAQCTAARTFGINRISAPCSDRLPLPDSTIDVVLALMQDESKYPMLIACKGGRHRAGAMVALFLKRVLGWSGERAYADAKKTGGYYPNGHKAYDKHFRYLLGLAAALLLFIVPAFGQSHPFIQPDVDFRVIGYQHSVPDAPVQTGELVLSKDGKSWVWVTTPEVKGPLTFPRFDKSFWVPAGLYATASAADIITTHRALDRGGFERNPIWAANDRKELRTAANVVAVAGVVGFAAYAEHRGHGRFARVLLWVAAGVRFTAAIWNHTRRR